MDAKIRYRKRLKLQAALTHVIQVLATNTVENIPPDRTDSLMAAQVTMNLIRFGK